MPRVDESERFAFDVIRRVTGFEVTHTDDGAQPRQVDGEWEDDNGTRHAVEVTRHIDQDFAWMMGDLETRGFKLSVQGLRWAWDVRITPAVSRKELEAELGGMLRYCEANNLERLDDVRWQVLDQWPLGRHIERGDLDAFALPSIQHDGQVSVLPHGDGGFAAGMNVVPQWLEQAVQGPLERKAAKLSAWHADQRHLFVFLSSSAVPFAVVYAMTEHEAIPARDPELPPTLDAVWLASEYANPPMSWHRSTGWERHDVLDDPQRSSRSV